MERQRSLVFFVNGKKVELANPNPETTLLAYLRQTLYLTGTKLACGQGACGACTVMVSSYDFKTKKIRHVSVNACLVSLCYLHGKAVTTVEGIGSSRSGLHYVQTSLIENHGMQCGFCTPGMVMTMYTLLRNNPCPSQEYIERVLEGNLCRCTGYRPIVDAFVSAKKKCPCGLGLCQQTEDSTARCGSDSFENCINQCSIQDVIFPPELQLNESYHTENVMFKGERYTWHRPTSLKEALLLKNRFPTAPITMGCNSIGYLLRKGKLTSDNIICGTNIEELTEIKITSEGIDIGAGVTMAILEETLKNLVPKMKDPEDRIVNALLTILRWVGVDQIRNTATIGGHVLSSAPNLDLQTFLIAAGAVLTFLSIEKGERFCKLGNDFFCNGDDPARSEGILVDISIQFLSQNEHIMGQKQPHRLGFDYGIVTSGQYVQLEKNTNIVKSLRLSFGGVDKKPILANKTSKLAIGRAWDEDMVSDMCSEIIKDLNNNYYDNIKYRLTLACSFFYKFFLRVQAQINSSDISEVIGLPYQAVSGLQMYDVPDTEGNKIVWKPIKNVSAEYISSGEAQFVDDIPSFQSELHAVLVTSKHAHARILSVDASKALAIKGVVDYIDRRDVPFNNSYGMWKPDSTLFAEDKVQCYGQCIGAVLAESQTIGEKAVQFVEVEYEKLNPILTIEDALQNGQIFEDTQRVTVGDFDGAVKQADFCIEGESSTGTQEHMYFETQSALVVPKKEQNELEIYASTQMLTEMQEHISKFLGIPRNRIIVRVKRVGGGFGGKLFNSFQVAGIAAVGAWKTNRPVRCVHDRNTDMRMTGKRHPSKTTYKVCFNKDGKINGLDLNLFLNAGYSHDISPYVVRLAMWDIDGSYSIKNIKGIGRLCQTNTPSNTGMRGFGSPQMMFALESVIDHVAHHLQMPPEEVRQINLVRKGYLTSSNQTVKDDNLSRCWFECREDSQYDLRRKEIESFNRLNRWRKRGLAMVPILFPIGYPAIYTNQAGALVLVYLDGSVLLTLAGAELGQGVHTKMIQVAATELDISHEKIVISEVSTATVPNTSESGGSQIADLNAGAIRNACLKIRKRMQPLRQAKPNGTWEDWVKDAYTARVSLSATGFFKSMEDAHEGYSFKTNKGTYANYHTYGTACTEVEIDYLSGEHQVNQVEIVMDVGKSLNPAIDVGQIEGGFVMGYGLMTMEQILMTSDGRMKASGPLEYKIPCIRNIPRSFKVKLLKDSGEVKTVYSSKGVGEPPLLLGISVFFAIKDAIMAARREAGMTDNYPLKCPATPERIRMACVDQIVDKCKLLETGPSENPRVIL